jgi:phosphosulfolactate phosphohydrolase-like enzyme
VGPVIFTTMNGTPIIISGDEAIILSNSSTQSVVAAELENPGTVSEALQALKAAVAYVIGIDPALSDDDWYGEFMAAMSITQYAEPVQVLFHARRQVQEMEAQNVGT